MKVVITMFLKSTPTRSGKIFLSFVQGYRDKNGKVKQKTIENIGWLDELQSKYDDPIVHFKNIAKQRTSEQITEYTIKNLNTQKIEMNSKPKNLGYSVLKKSITNLV